MNKYTKADLDTLTFQCTLDALEVMREAYRERATKDGFSKKEFAEEVGCNPSYLSRLLNGHASNVNYQTLSRMLIALDFYPEVNLCDMRVAQVAPNFKHCEDVEDSYERSSVAWRSRTEGMSPNVNSRGGFKSNLNADA